MYMATTISEAKRSYSGNYQTGTAPNHAIIINGQRCCMLDYAKQMADMNSEVQKCYIACCCVIEHLLCSYKNGATCLDLYDICNILFGNNI